MSQDTLLPPETKKANKDKKSKDKKRHASEGTAEVKLDIIEEGEKEERKRRKKEQRMLADSEGKSAGDVPILYRFSSYNFELFSAGERSEKQKDKKKHTNNENAANAAVESDVTTVDSLCKLLKVLQSFLKRDVEDYSPDGGKGEEREEET